MLWCKFSADFIEGVCKELCIPLYDKLLAVILSGVVRKYDLTIVPSDFIYDCTFTIPSNVL